MAGILKRLAYGIGRNIGAATRQSILGGAAYSSFGQIVANAVLYGNGSAGGNAIGTYPSNQWNARAGAYDLTDMLNNELSNISGAMPGIDPGVAAPLSPVPDVIGDNISYVIRTLDGNIRFVDQKVQSLGSTLNQQSSLLEYNKRLLERTNRLLENETRRASSDRFSAIENRMEMESMASLIQAQVAEEVDRRVAELEARMGKQQDNLLGAILSGIGTVGAGAIGGAGAAGAAMKLGAGTAGKLASRFLGPIGIGLMMNDALYGNELTKSDEAVGDYDTRAMAEEQFLQSILDKVQKGQSLTATEQQVYEFHRTGKAWGTTAAGGNFSKPRPIREKSEELTALTDQLDQSRQSSVNVFTAQYDLYDVSAGRYYVNADDYALRTRRSASIHSDGEVVISSKTRIVLSAPEVQILGLTSYGPAEANPGSASTTGGGSGYSPEARQAASLAQGSDFAAGFVPGRMTDLPPGVGSDANPLPGGGELVGSDNRAEAFNFFKSKGWSDEAAAGIVGNLMWESGSTDINYSAGGDGGAAYGAAQWHQARRSDFERIYGKPMQQATKKEQLEFIDWELRNTEKGAGDLLAGAKSAEEAAVIFSNEYERPNAALANNETRADYASQVLGNAESYKKQADDAAAKAPLIGSGDGVLQFDKRKLDPNSSEWTNNSPKINDIVTKGAEVFGEGSPYGIRAFSGNEGRGSNHRGSAVDWEVYDKRTGEGVPQPYLSTNSSGGWTKEKGTGGATENFRLYEQAAQAMKLVQMRDYPELNNTFRYGGYFGGKMGEKYGANDSMHVDINPRAGGAMAAGSWAGGLNKNYEGVFNAGSKPSTGIGDLMEMESDKAIAEYRKRLFEENNWVRDQSTSGFTTMASAPPVDYSKVPTPFTAAKNIVTANSSATAVAPVQTAKAPVPNLKLPEIPDGPKVKKQKNSHDGLNLSSIDLLDDALSLS